MIMKKINKDENGPIKSEIYTISQGHVYEMNKSKQNNAKDNNMNAKANDKKEDAKKNAPSTKKSNIGTKSNNIGTKNSKGNFGVNKYSKGKTGKK